LTLARSLVRETNLAAAAVPELIEARGLVYIS